MIRKTSAGIRCATIAPPAPAPALIAAIIHRVSDEKLARLSQFGYQPEQVRITDRGLELTVVPRR